MIMRKPLVSIIVPIYNVEPYLRKCIDSILEQSYKNLEIILVDDGSTDKSGTIADQYEKKFKHVKVIHQPNEGLSSARNAGIDNSNGEWLAFIDSDDYIRKDFIESLINIAMENNTDIVTCSFKPFSNDGSILKKIPKWPNETLSGFEAIDNMQANRLPAYICINIFKKELFIKNNIRFPVGRLYEDIATKIKLLYYAKKVSFTNKQLYFYLIRGESITGKNYSETKYKDIEYAIEEVSNFLINSEHSDDFPYLNYFKLCALFGILNDMAKSPKKHIHYWRKIRKKIYKLYPKTIFPNKKMKLLFCAILVMSTNKTIYSKLYRRTKRG